MNLGRGIWPSQQNDVPQNGESWIPLTPQKPILPRSNVVPAEMQGSYLGGGSNWQDLNWPDLLGIYGGVLQTNINNNSVDIPQEFITSGLTGPAFEEPSSCTSGVGITQDFITSGLTGPAFEEPNTCTSGGGVTQDFITSDLTGPALGEPNTRGAAVVDNTESFTFGAGSYTQRLGNNSAVWCRDSQPQYQAIRNASYEFSSNGRPDDNALYAPTLHGTPVRSSYTSHKPYTPCSRSHLEGHSLENMSAGSIFQMQNNNINSNPKTAGYNTSQPHKDGFPVPFWSPYDLNSPPRTEGGIALSANSCLLFAPVTPDQGKQLKNLQHDEGSSQRKDNQDNFGISVQQKIIEQHSNELLQDVVDSSSADIRASLQEAQTSLEVPEGIDLNKTPKQKPPRRKHRPKVVVEGKPKRTPKPKNNSSDENPAGKRKYVRKMDLSASTENPVGKRKYVRKKGLTASATHGNVTNEIKILDDGSEAKSCRRALNFDVENQAEHEHQERIKGNQAEKPYNLNLEHQDPECSAENNQANPTSGIFHKEKQPGYSAEKQHEGTKVTFTPPTNQMLAGVSSLFIPAAATATANNHTLNVIARNLMRTPSLCQPSSQIGYNQRHKDILGEGAGRAIYQANIDRTRQLLLQGPQVPQDIAGTNERRGSKRAYYQTSALSHPQLNTLMGSQILHRGISDEDEHYISRSNLGFGSTEICKRKKVLDMSHSTTTSLLSYIPAVHGDLRQMELGVVNGTNTSSSTSHIKGKKPDYNLEKGSTSKKQNSVYQISVNQYMNPTAVGNHFLGAQHTSSQVHLHKEQIAKMSQPRCHDHNHNSQIAIANWNLQSLIQITPRSTQEHETETSYTNMPTKRQMWRSATSNQPLSGGRLLYDYHNPPRNVAGASSMGQKEVPDLTDQITNQLRGLHISNKSKEIVGNEHTALIQYNGSKEIVGKEHTALVQYKGDGSIVPYEQFDPIKRRKPRPKVDLDPETNRLWNLLMGKEGSESTETTNKHTEKWWEEERIVFQGRVDSFIARMHLVQGDRRFSPWKGSVVDSVIGVFLTQNVSDHLSSSAFMSLAAKFPLHQTKQACWWNGENPIIEEPVQIIDPDGTITYHARITKQPVYYQSSTTSSETSEQRVEDLVTGTIASSEKKNKRANDEVISSQASPDSFIYQHIEEARSSSGSNSETEDQLALCNSHKNGGSEVSFLHRERTCMLQEYQSHGSRSLYMEKMQEPSYQKPKYPAHNGQNPTLNGGDNTYAYPSKFNMQHVQGFSPSCNHWSNMSPDLVVQEENSFELSGKGDLSFLPLTGSTISMLAGIGHPTINTGGMTTGINASAQPTGTPMVQAPRETQLAFPDKPPEQSHFHSVTSSGYSQSSIINNQRNGSKSIQLESTYSSEPTRPAEALSKCQTGETTTSNKPTDGAGAAISNGRKRKVQGEKTKAFDWDSLRKQVHSKGGRKNRSKDAMDSLDYEALRLADVKEISNTIKERGMNNMLAERMKDFLNRLVQEHERVDLEWLRDVPPDKAKDYLLSIRGLGLKSVECVRLLTLHNVAFPVDTNVGRIAVRLGWVPLQPLPESLQLHLLELYPVLESIQKYLWPRLCKLDQRTLYELHYQMITFGKVFCTKSKPNCNACPMRGECRHFASAFASARLALPGPEEKSIVNSTAPIRVEEIPVPITKPLPLPPADTNLVRETCYINCNSEPIVHEPMTPEPPTEVTESDIEDAFYDDPDEIPMIKLNIEEFTTNLQSFMQEGDLSKAIVALNPQAASIPTPKLKNISRLRTEHQVYELPDTHPLLKGLDRRELDDPSPYLLAIWTPGETANSIQPPDSKCHYQELGQLCNETTCFSCNSVKETNFQTVRGTLLIPCRTAMRGSFPLNGTYFQVNEVFADHESSINPIDVPRALIWNLPRRTVYFGTSVTSIFKGLTTEGIQFCFWRGFVCVRGFDHKTRAPRPLMARLHFPASKMVKTKNAENQDKARPSRE